MRFDAVAALIICLACFCATEVEGAGQAGPKEKEFKFTNPDPKIKAISVEEAKKIAPQRLGSEPQLDADERDDIDTGEIVVRSVGSNGAGKRYEAIALVDATPDAVMEVLKDYDSFVKIMPNLEAVQYRWDGNLAYLMESVKAGFFTFNYWLRIAHYGNMYIEFELDRGDIKEIEGYYKLFSRNGGAKTLLVYHVYSDPGMALPQFVIDLLSKSTLPKVLKAVRKEVIRRRNERVRDGGSGENVR